MKRLLTVVYLSVLALVLLAGCKPSLENYTVIVSLDGFRWDYPEYYDMPFMDSLESAGVKARMQSSYPSATFPNHYAMATGLVPDHNGIVNNSFWNPETQHAYGMKDQQSRYNPKYYLGEPIWATAQRQGVPCASIYWVGSDIAIGGVYPKYYRHWDANPHWKFEQRAKEVVRLMSLPEEDRPRLIMAYFDEPDHQGHVSGPISPETGEIVHEMDSIIHKMYLQLKALPYGDRINLIVTGDHGMTNISRQRFIGWYDVLPEEWVERIIGSNPTSIWPAEGHFEDVFQRLSELEHVRVWKHGEVPEYLNYGTSDRVGEIIVCPDLGWQFNYSPSSNQGTHGYDPTEPDMMIAFRAIGPDFKEGYEAPFTEGEQTAFHNTDLYPLLCHLLGVEPAPVDGKLERIKNILR